MAPISSLLLEHGHDEKCSHPGHFDKPSGRRIALLVNLLLGHVGNVEQPLGRSHTRRRRQRARMHHRVAPPGLRIGGRRVVHCHHAEAAIFTKLQHAEFGFADARGIFQHGIEDRLQLAGRRADDAQHVRSRRLLLQRLPQLIEQPRILDGDNGLGGKIL